MIRGCPCCQVHLATRKTEDLVAHFCPDCAGVLVGQRFLVPLLKDVTQPLAGQIDFDEAIEAIPEAEGPRPCPGCDNPMNTFGYMETNLAQAHRCNACKAVWMDPEALTVVAVLFARTNVRRQVVDDRQAEHQDSLNRRVHLMLRARFVSKALG